MAPNYQNGKIYRIICSDGHFYIGSTVTTLGVRMNAHVQTAKKHPERPLYNHCTTLGWDNVNIELLEEYPCNSRKELTAQEDYHIQRHKKDPKCLNCNRAHLTPEEHIQYHREYVEANREVVTERRAKYRQENAEELRAKAREYAKAHPEWKKESRRKHYEENKELVKGQIKAYYEENKDAIKAYRNEWARKKRAEKAGEKAKARKEKKEARLAHEHETIQCDCGGHYQRFHKNRHMASKSHQRYEQEHPAQPANIIVEVPQETI